MKEKLAKLIDVKSIMTLLLTVVFCVLALCGVIAADQFLTIFTVIVGFYFGTQSQKSVATANSAASPQQGETLPESPEPIYETVNTADVQRIHPPDTEPVAKVGFEY